MTGVRSLRRWGLLAGLLLAAGATAAAFVAIAPGPGGDVRPRGGPDDAEVAGADDAPGERAPPRAARPRAKRPDAVPGPATRGDDPAVSGDDSAPRVVAPVAQWRIDERRGPARLAGAIDVRGGSVAGATIVVGEGITARTSSEGVFEIEGIGPGDHDVHVTAPGFVSRTLRWRVSPPAPDPVKPDAVRWTLERGVQFGVTVRTPAGRAVVGADVALIPDQPDGRFARFVVTTDEHGVAHFRDVPGGNASIWVHPGRADGLPTCRIVDTRVDVADGKQVEQRAPVGVPLRGRVEDERGAPVPAAQVVVLDSPGAIPRRVFADATTDALGVFELGIHANARSASLYVVAPATDGTGWRFAATAASWHRDAGDVTIRLAAGGAIEGRVVGPDGAPIARRDVSFDGGRGCPTPPTIVRTDAAGRFRVAGIADATYSVRFPPAEEGGGPTLLLRPAQARPSAEPVEFRALPTANLSISVRDASGAHVRGALGLTCLDDPKYRIQVQTSGDASLTNVPPGRYEVVLVRDGLPSERLGEVEAGPVTHTLVVPR